MKKSKAMLLTWLPLPWLKHLPFELTQSLQVSLCCLPFKIEIGIFLKFLKNNFMLIIKGDGSFVKESVGYIKAYYTTSRTCNRLKVQASSKRLQYLLNLVLNP